MPMPRLLPPIGLAVLLLPVLTACGSDSSGPSVAVAASDDACQVAETELDAGKVTFEVTNKGSKVTEVYVYAAQDGEFTKVVSEVENIGPGTSRDLSVSLAGGTYEIACKPGQRGEGIRQKVTVAGGGGKTESDAGYDRELELTVDSTGLSGLGDGTASQGERVELKLRNDTGGSRELEVLDPSDKVVSEVEVATGEEAEVVVELAQAGDWTVKVEGGAAEVEKTLTVA